MRQLPSDLETRRTTETAKKGAAHRAEAGAGNHPGYDHGAAMICRTCQAEFRASRAGHLQCRPCRRKRDRPHGGDHHKNRRSLTAASEFIGVDGEGVTSKAGNHRYVLLTVGDKSLYNAGRKLKTLEIFEFLYDQLAAHPSAAFIGFYLGYDFAQWLRDLPEERARMLITDEGIAKRRRTAAPYLPPFPVHYEGWDFDMLGMRRFRLRPSAPLEPGSKKFRPWLTICDVGAFFQCSFLKAIDPRKARTPIVTQAEYDQIAAGKDGRREHEFGREMIEYNRLECAVLARLMAQQRDGLLAENLKLKKNQWIGPGQAAQAWFRKIKAPTAEMVRMNTDPRFRDAARQSYYAGWFEIFAHGLVPGASFGYDINSAYPKIMAALPCLLHGKFRDDIDAPLALIKATVHGRHSTVGAMLHRTPKGNVLRPHNTIGWYWRHEIEAAQRAGFIDRYDIEEARGYYPCDCSPPLAPIAELYRGRLAVGKDTPAGKAKKRVYNSGYGKTAQSIGQPAFANAIYASLITAGCRAMILDAIRTHPAGARDLLMVATDSVTFRSPHPSLDLDADRLGAWTETRHDNLTLFMPGVYWDDASREKIRRGDDPTLKSRGISAPDLARRLDVLDRAWSRFERDGWPRLILPVTFSLVSPRQALARNKWHLCGTVLNDQIRLISSNPKSKRVATGPGRSRPYHWSEPRESTPYDKHFGEELEELQAMEFGDHPDMPISGMLPDLLRS